MWILMSFIAVLLTCLIIFIDNNSSSALMYSAFGFVLGFTLSYIFG